MANEKKEEIEIEGLKIEANRTMASVDENVEEGPLLAEQNARAIIQEAKEEAEHIKASAERDANRIIAEARTNAQKRIETLMMEAEGTAKNRAQELLADTVEEIRYQVPPEVECKIVQYASEIVSEAERTAQKIIEEARRRAETITNPVSDKCPVSETSKTQQEPNAPNLLDELRKRFCGVKFGEAQMQQQASIGGDRINLDIYDFPVLAGSDNEPIGTYSVHMYFGEIVAKRYQHNGKLLVARGRIAESEYQSLQQFVEEGRLHEIPMQLPRLGTRNYVLYDFPLFIWNARHGREDRYSNDVNFP